MLCGLLTPDSGEGACLGFDILRQAGEIKRRTGYMTQKFSLYEDLTLAENLQFTAAYKERGALNKLLQLTEAEKKRGVIAASAGNHSQGLAYHAARLGIPVTIVMPRSTPFVKVQQTRAFGAEVVLEGAGYADASAIRAHYRRVGDTVLVEGIRLARRPILGRIDLSAAARHCRSGAWAGSGYGSARSCCC